MADPNPYSPPRSLPAPFTPRLAHVQDGSLVLPSGHPLPPICIKCGASESLEPRHHEFRHRSPWLFLCLLLGAIPGLILLLAETRRAPVVLPLCPACNDRWKRAAIVWRLTLVVTLLLMVSTIVVFQLSFVMPMAWYVPFLVLAMAVVVPVVGHVLKGAHLIRAARIVDGTVTLRGVAPAVLEAVANPGTVAGWQDSLRAFLDPPPAKRPRKKRRKPGDPLRSQITTPSRT